MDGIIVRCIQLPSKTRGFVLDDEDGNYNVYINCNLCIEEQEKTAKHELEHVKGGHLFKDMPIADAEREASGI